MTKDRQALVLQSQMQLAQTKAMYYHARIVSGFFKDRIVNIGGSTGPQMDEPALLRDELYKMDRHIQSAQNCLDQLIELMTYPWD